MSSSPPEPRLTSPDGHWEWDGYRWVPLPNVFVPPPPAQPFTGPNGTSVVCIRTLALTKKQWTLVGLATLLSGAIVPLVLFPLAMFLNRGRHLGVYAELDGGYWTSLCRQYPDNPKRAKRARLLPRQVVMQASAPTCKRCVATAVGRFPN